MKKYILGLIAVLAISFASAQTVTPRMGTGANNDNTGRSYTYQTVTITPTSTMVAFPSNVTNEKLVVISSVTISPTFTANVTQNYIGDKLRLLVAASSVSRTITLSTNFIGSAATMTIAANKKSQMGFVFDGAKWIEIDRTVEP